MHQRISLTAQLVYEALFGFTVHSVTDGFSLDDLHLGSVMRTGQTSKLSAQIRLCLGIPALKVPDRPSANDGAVPIYCS